jgi:single-strand DNA-binding protein
MVYIAVYLYASYFKKITKNCYYFLNSIKNDYFRVHKWLCIFKNIIHQLKKQAMLKMTLIGHIGQDATNTDVNGKTVTNFSVAHTEKYKDKNGVEQKNTTWVNCSMWEREKLAPYLKKGTQVFIEGTPDARAYQSKDQELKSSLDCRVQTIQLLGGARKEGESSAADAHDDLPF